MQEYAVFCFDDYYHYSKIPNAIMRIGSEGCIHKFFSILKEFEKLIVKGGRWRIVTPRIPDKYFERTLGIFKAFYKQGVSFYLTVNDYGLLYGLQDIGDLSKYNIYLGRTLVRSLLYVPWNEYLLRKEESLTKKSLEQINMKDQGKLEVLMMLGVKGIEISAVPGIEEQLPYFVNKKIEIGLHLDSVMATVGRVCPILRYYNGEIGTCSTLCNKILKISTEKIWNNNGAMYQYKSDGIQIPDMVLIDNLVLIPINAASIDNINKIIFIRDYRLKL